MNKQTSSGTLGLKEVVAMGVGGMVSGGIYAVLRGKDTFRTSELARTQDFIEGRKVYNRKHTPCSNNASHGGCNE
ncbi:MAG: hypothetical protein ACLFWB_00345 [Armatimonadota bacterium]